MNLQMEFSRHLKWQHISLQLLSVVIGVLAVSTLLVGAFLWGYISRKYKKDRRTSPACQCDNPKQSGGRHGRKSGDDMICDSEAHIEKTAFRQPSPIVTDFRGVLRGTHPIDAEEGYAQVLAEAREAAASTKPSKSAAIDLTSMPIPSGLASPLYFTKSITSGRHELDLDYLEYELQVQARAREFHKNSFAPGGRHAWKSIMFWKRNTKVRGMRAYVSAAPTPMHPSYIAAVYKPSTPGPTTPGSKQGSLGPLYTDDFSSLPPQYWSNRPKSGPVSGLKVMTPRRDDCNMSPYVPLNRTQRIPSGPLYLV